ncbi:MAG: ABC transporter permease [Lachnospiraceae bacterium]|jgi:hypothetical protein
MIIQSVKMAWKSIAGNKMRSFLTMLGIIIGVMSLVVLVSLTSGATSTVTDKISALGSNLLMITVSDDKGNPIKLNDLSEFIEFSEIEDVSPIAQSSVTADYSDNSETASVYGVTGGYMDINGLTLGSGRFIKNPDVDNHTNVAVISADLAEDVVGYINATGESIQLNGTKFLIIGVLEAEETSSETYSNYELYIPFTSLVRLVDSVPTNITSFCVSSESDESLDAAENKIESVLMERFENDDEAFSIMNQSEIMEALGDVTNILSLLLGGIAAISLLVGGIGIMNIMLVSVTERTREIGIRKAIGAGRFAIMLQFLIEAMMVSLMGCFIGVVLSWGILKILSVVAAGYELNFTLSMSVVWVAIIFSTVIGIVFGIYPAKKAAKKNPIEALRYIG